MFQRVFLRASQQLALVALLLLAGCYPITRMQTPRTVPAGRVQVALGAAGQTPPPGSSTVHFTPDLALRVGVHERVDLGARVRPSAGEFGVKIQLARSDVEISIAPALLVGEEHELFTDHASAAENVDFIAGRATLYVGSSADATVSGWIAPTLDVGERSFEQQDWTIDAPGSHTQPLFAPGFLTGVVIAASSSVRLLIELGVFVPTGGSAKYLDGVAAYQTRLGPGDTRLELNLAFLFGSHEIR